MYTKIFKKLILLVYIFLLLSYRFSCTHGASLFFFNIMVLTLRSSMMMMKGVKMIFFNFHFCICLYFFVKHNIFLPVYMFYTCIFFLRTKYTFQYQGVLSCLHFGVLEVRKIDFCNLWIQFLNQKNISSY